jgi:hypothetical protein
MCEEATLVSFKVLDQHLPGGRIIETRPQDSHSQNRELNPRSPVYGEVLSTGPQLL